MTEKLQALLDKTVEKLNQMLCELDEGMIQIQENIDDVNRLIKKLQSPYFNLTTEFLEEVDEMSYMILGEEDEQL